MKRSALALFLAVACAGVAPAQTLDFQGLRSEEQLRGGVQAYHRGFYADSLVSLEKALSYKPSNILAQAWLGRVLWKSGFEPEALKTWERLEASGKAGTIVRDWIDTLRLRTGTARESPRRPVFIVSAELDGNLKGEYPFRRPSSVRPRADGTFFVCAFGSNEILLFDPNFSLRRTLRGGLEGFDRPFDLLELPDGTLYVTEYGSNRISVLSPQGDRIKSFGRKGRGGGDLLGPQYLASDERGYLYVTDWGNSRVNKYDTDGNFILSIGGLAGPSGLAVRDDRLYVSENLRKRIAVYDLSGNFLSAIGEGTLEGPEGLSFGAGGELFVSDANRVMETDVEKDTWRVKADSGADAKRLVHQAMTRNGDLLGIDFDGNKVLLLSDAASLYSGYAVRVDRVNAVKFPEVFVDVSVEDRLGRPIVGLAVGNFTVTEAHRPAGSPSLTAVNTGARSVDVTLLVEGSPAMAPYKPELERAASDIYALVNRIGRIKAVSAGERPVLEAGFGEARLRFLSSALGAEPSSRWRLDAAVRMAGEELLYESKGARRAVVFLCSGAVDPRGFATYSLTELAAFLRNNSIAFCPVYFGSRGLGEELSYLAAETGGTGYPVLTPGGMADVVRDLSSRVSPLYTLRFISSLQPEFGTRYLPLEVEVTMQKVSGRDECGYFSPPSAAGKLEPLVVPEKQGRAE